MAFIVIKSTPLDADAKKRLGDRILHAVQLEGLKAAETVIRYEVEDSSTYLDGTLVNGLGVKDWGLPNQPYPISTRTVEPPEIPVMKPKGRHHTKEALDALRNKLADLLCRDGSLSSFEAQAKLGLKDQYWAPNTLRRLFHEFTEEGAIRVEGQRRGTRYVWIVDEPVAAVKLEKA